MGSLGDNAIRVQRAIERWNSGDRTAPLDDIHPDVEIHTGISEAFQGEPFCGHEGARQWLAALDENFETWEIVMDEVHERGRHGGGARLGARRAGAAAASSSISRWAGCTSSDDDKLFRLHTYYDRARQLPPVD